MRIFTRRRGFPTIDQLKMPTRSRTTADEAGVAAPRGGRPSNELLTTDEVIDRLLEDANLRRVAATCVLPAVRVGSTWRFRRSDLDEWIRRQTAVPASN